MANKHMTKAYRIVGWQDKYEVTSDDREAKPGSVSRTLRVSPLRYIRYPVVGHTMPVEDSRLKQAAKGPAQYEAALCLWPKLLGLAGVQKREYRGWILTERQKPATVDDLALFTGIRRKTIAVGLELLAHADVGLIEFCPFPSNSAEDCEKLQNPANPLINETDTKTDTNTKTDTDTEGQTTPSDSAVLSKVSGESGRPSGIQSGSGGKSKNLNPELFAQTVALKLNLSSTDSKQLRADTRCFMRAAEAHIIPGHLGKPHEASKRCYAKAEEISKSRTVHQRRRARVWVAWLKTELEKKGHKWGK